MNILMITENDPAGMGIVFAKAINRHSGHSCRLVTTRTRYNFNFAKDLHLPDLDQDGLDEIRDLLEKCDIIHFHILADENIDLGPIRVADFIKGKAICHHHHGHPDFRADPEKYRAKYRRLNRKALVSTPDLLKLLPEALWQPNLVPVEDPLYLPKPVAVNGSLLIGQSATRKDLKNTDDLVAVVSTLAAEIPSPRLKLDIIENTDHRACLERKRDCHVIFDHMQGYFGVSSLESLSQGKPVIAGLDEWNRIHIEDFSGTQDLPWLICRTKTELARKLGGLATEKRLAAEYGQKSRAFMCNHWHPQKAVQRLIGFYDSL